MRKSVKILKEEKARNLRAIQRKYNSLKNAIYKLPKVKLDKPRWMGYKRYFFLRDDILRRKDVKDFQEILNLLNNTVYSRTKDGFSRYDFDDLPLHHKQRIKTLSEKAFKDLREPLKKYFVRFTHWDHRKKEVRYEFIHPWMFVLKVKHHYITEVPFLDADMESEIGELENRIYRDNLWPLIYKAHGRSYHHRDDYGGRKIRLIDLLTRSEVEDYWKD